MIPVDFQYFAPSSLEEALALLTKHGEDARLLAGGQSLLPLMKLRLSAPAYLIDLGRIPGLTGIDSSGNGDATLSIGAMTPYYEIEESSLLRQRCALLSQTASVVADVQVRNRGTIGGSLAHADPTGDMPAAAIAVEARLKATGPSGERWLEADDFFTGFFSTALAHDEILTEIRVPSLDGWTATYRKAAPRASGFAIAGIAVCLRQSEGHVCQEIRVGVTGVSDRPYRAHELEQALRGKTLDRQTIEQAVGAIAEDVWIMDDFRASSEYRAHLARVYAARAIAAARDATPVP